MLMLEGVSDQHRSYVGFYALQRGEANLRPTHGGKNVGCTNRLCLSIVASYWRARLVLEREIPL